MNPIRLPHLLGAAALLGLGLAAQAQDAEPPLGVNVLEATFKWRPNYVSDDMLMHADKDANNWLLYGKDYQGTRYSQLTQITTDNVRKLVPKWNLSFGVNEAQVSQTTVVNGRIYVTASQNKVFSVDGTTGKMLWKYERSLPGDLGPKLCCDAVNRGVAVYRDMVFMATLDTHVVALNNTTGQVVWEAKLGDYKTGEIFTSMPVVAKGMVIVGNSGGDVGANHGRIIALDPATGKVIWETKTRPTSPDHPQAKTWANDSWKTGGASAWLPGTYDPATDTIYIGTSNAAPDFNREARLGDNLYTATLLALEPKTGKVKWHRQEVPNDTWDFDASYEALVVPDGKGKNVIVHLNKNGFVYVMDKDNGALHNAWQYSENVNWTKGIDLKTGLPIDPVYPETGKQKLHCPNLLGGRSWNHGAYNPSTKLWYTHGMEVCNTVTSAKQGAVPGIGGLSLGLSEITLTNPPGKKADGWFGAIDPLTGKSVWRVRYEMPAMASVLATASGLVFTGDMVGNLYAYDADNGKELWKFNAGSGSRGGPISYSVNGKQYIAIPTGLGSHAPGFLTGAFPQIRDLPGGAALLVFSVD